MSRANVIALPEAASSRNGTRTWPFGVLLSLVGSSPDPGGLKSTLGLPGEGSSAPLKQPKVRLNCMVSRFVSFSRPGSLRTGEQKCLWL